jgi:predicted nucleotidyltransferase
VMDMAASQVAQEIIQDILGKLLASYSPQKVILFGSYAYGNPQPDSDIDLLVVKETSERFIDRWVTVRRLLSDPRRTLPLEVIVLTPQEVSKRLDIGDQFLAEILERGKVLYAA